MKFGLATKVEDLHKFSVARLSEGMSKKLAAALLGTTFKSKQSEVNVGDLLAYLPSRYEDRSNFLPIDQLVAGVPASVELYVRVAGAYQVGRKRSPKAPPLYIFEITAGDADRVLRPVVLSWFISGKGAKHAIDFYNNKFARGTRFVVHGEWEWDARKNTFSMRPPKPDEIEILSSGSDSVVDDEDDARELGSDAAYEPIHSSRTVPVYRKLGNFQTKRLREIVFGVLELLGPGDFPETLPDKIVAKFKLLSRFDSVRRIHFPDADDSVADYERFRSQAHRRIIFEEFFRMSVAIETRRSKRVVQKKGSKLVVSKPLQERLIGSAPFELTGAQKRVIDEIFTDFNSTAPMNRLVQGDVGSGKTIVAFLSMLAVAECGYQSVLMAPTEILAEQHFKNALNLLSERGVQCALLTGSMKASEKRTVRESIATGEVKLLIGTHAVIQDGVEFERLGFVVIDEQHRFGVLQRGQLMEKGSNPDVLVMTATPIPRSLAMTVYGDLDVSIIDELPPGRTPIKTVVVGEDKRAGVYKGIERELAIGRQAYVVYPLVEESEKLELKAATEMYENLRSNVFPSRRVGLLHGKMKSAEKDSVMGAFKAGEIDILVSTTVIEVGVDVPNASVMVIEHAERFGLSQLHQLRGRVGRGADQSYCILMTDYKKTAIAKERLGIMEETNDGFKIAEKDLMLRGPGEVLGTRQAGLPVFTTGEIVRDFEILEAAKKEAKALLSSEEDVAKNRDLLNEINADPRFKLGGIG
jgi:ATP-dependent DNA helicase RecG